MCIDEKRNTDEEVKKFKEEQKKKVKLIEVERKAWNVDDTSDENPPTGEGPNWDDYWKYWTKGLFEDAVCACCGEKLTSSNRVGAHIRLDGENDNTNNAWIALYCSSCNNWKVRKPRKVRKGSKIVRTTMAKTHKNATPVAK